MNGGVSFVFEIPFNTFNNSKQLASNIVQKFPIDRLIRVEYTFFFSFNNRSRVFLVFVLDKLYDVIIVRNEQHSNTKIVIQMDQIGFKYFRFI